VHFFITYNEETKASIVERLNRTLKIKMWKYFTHRETLTYVEVLSEMVASYNHTVHIPTFNDTGFGLLVVSGKEVHVVFLEKLLKYSVGKFSSFVCL
jgi:hypothetical protein